MHTNRFFTAKRLRLLLPVFCLAFLLSLGWQPSVMKVATAASPAQGNPAKTGQWSAPIWLDFIPIHVHVLPNGKVLMWGRQIVPGEVDANGFSQSYIFDPATNSIVASPFNSTTNLFCSGHCFLPDGRLIVTGGHHGDDVLGEPHTNLFDPATNTYSRGQDMGPDGTYGRWYPTMCAMGNGESFVMSGTNIFGQLNALPQVFQTNETWRSLTSAIDANIPLYPRLLLAPNSRVFMAGERSLTRYISTSGTGAWQDVADTGAGSRDYGSAVMYDDGKVLIMGGGAPTNTAQIINLSRDIPAWTPQTGAGSIGAMVYARKQLNATLLPDGNVLVTGGTSIGFTNPAGAVFAAEMWNSSSKTFDTMASAARPRLYHSTAVLLPDGRVLTGGGGGLHPPDHSIDEKSIEIYSPPYLFNGDRPAIASAPATANHGDQIFVGTPQATRITKVTLIRLSSVTHAFNQNQRINDLSFRRLPGGLNVTVPGSAHLCPPGHYMLFLVNDGGIPSIASIIKIGMPSGTSNAINDQRYFTRQHYYDFLNRDEDAGGLAFWTNQITQCGTDPNCISSQRLNVSRAFWESSEFQKPLIEANDPLFYPPPPPGEEYNRKPFIEKNYSIYLRRKGDSGGVAFWLNNLNNCIATTNNVSQCYNNIIQGFIVSGEYLNRFYKP